MLSVTEVFLPCSARVSWHTEFLGGPVYKVNVIFFQEGEDSQLRTEMRNL